MLGSTQTMDRVSDRTDCIFRTLRLRRQKLRREIEVWWRLSHPNILPCLGFWISETVGGYGGILSPVRDFCIISMRATATNKTSGVKMGMPSPI
jgi:hypothetical protein